MSDETSHTNPTTQCTKVVHSQHRSYKTTLMTFSNVNDHVMPFNSTHLGDCSALMFHCAMDLESGLCPCWDGRLETLCDNCNKPKWSWKNIISECELTPCSHFHLEDWDLGTALSVCQARTHHPIAWGMETHMLGAWRLTCF